MKSLENTTKIMEATWVERSKKRRNKAFPWTTSIAMILTSTQSLGNPLNLASLKAKDKTSKISSKPTINFTPPSTAKVKVIVTQWVHQNDFLKCENSLLFSNSDKPIIQPLVYCQII